MTKKEALERWRKLEPDQPIMGHMTAIPYKSKGSTYGTCGVRIDGSPEFVDAVMSHLKEMLTGEGIETRLQLSRNVVDGEKLGKGFTNKDAGAECVYIRLVERGPEGVVMAAIMDSVDKRGKGEV